MSCPRAVLPLLTAFCLTALPCSAGPEPAGLSAREAAALRKALYGLDTSHLRQGREEVILRETFIGTPSLSAEERLAVERHLRGHVPTMQAAQELLNLRLYWRSRSTDRFVFWWNPALSDDSGIPARSPTTSEASALERVAEAAAGSLGIEVPNWMPYRIDPRVNTARSHPREDLRWGVWAPDAEAAAAVVEVVARELGGVRGLWEPLGVLLGTCLEDEDCRLERLAAAETLLGEAGPVGLAEVLTAGQLGGPGDPAQASALLLTDLILREHGPDALSALLGGLRPGLSGEEVQRVVRATLGRSARSLDRRLANWLLKGRRDRFGR